MGIKKMKQKIVSKLRGKKRYIMLFLGISTVLWVLPSASNAIMLAHPAMVRFGAQQARSAFLEKEQKDQIVKYLKDETVSNPHIRKGLPRVALGLSLSIGGRYLSPRTTGYFRDFIVMATGYGQKNFSEEYSYWQFRSPFVSLIANIVLDKALVRLVGTGSSYMSNMSLIRLVLTIALYPFADRAKRGIASFVGFGDGAFYVCTDYLLNGPASLVPINQQVTDAVNSLSLGDQI